LGATLATKSYYEVLRVDSDADFSALRRAYRNRAMECHPDRYDGDAVKADEFKLLVEAFNVLTDPVKRQQHDHELGLSADHTTESPLQFDMGFYPEDEDSILGTLADDILEELIVGNSLHPHETSLATLMMDLERTEQFCLFREAKTLLYHRSAQTAEPLFRRYVSSSPGNILGRYFLSKCCRINGKWGEAETQLEIALKIGNARNPPLPLTRIRRELAALRNKRPGLLGFLHRVFGPSVPKQKELPVDVQERRALNRAINRLAIERERRRKSLPEKT
jgi:curved DNA-binding protein CbpA